MSNLDDRRMKTDAETYLRAIGLMLDRVDERIPDESLTAKPYEITPAEMRDLKRMSGMSGPLTRVGRAALAEARR